MKGELVSNEREKLISQLMAGFKREETLNINQLNELEEQLSSEEAKVSVDTLAILRTRTLFATGKFVQAYNVLADGLRRAPQSLSLQLERAGFLGLAQNVLADQMHQDPMNPMIELLYEILRRESAILASHQVEYLKFLVGHQRYAEAARLAVPLVALCPSLLNLREQVELIAAKAPRPLLNLYLLTQPARIRRQCETKELSAKEIILLKEKLSSLRQAMNGEVPVHIIDKQLREVIGVLSEDKPLITNYKDFYYLQAIIEERKENYFEALMLFRALVEMDPCSLEYRRSMEIEANHVNMHFIEQDKKGTLKVDLVSAYPLLREMGHVSYTLLTEVCLAEVKKDLKAQAKEKMMYLVALNPMDSDYVEAAQKVAEAMKDELWEAELLRLLQRIREELPWAIELQMKIDSKEMEDVA
jgi:tetratricopeptide (TPR) repeat protein